MQTKIPKDNCFPLSMPQLQQYTSIYKYIWIAGYSNWNIIINTAHVYAYSFGQFARIMSFPPSNTVGVTSVLL